MQDQEIKSRLAIHHSSYRTSAGVRKYVMHLRISKFNKEFIVVLFDCVSGQRATKTSSSGSFRFLSDGPVYDLDRDRRIEIYDIVNDELHTIATGPHWNAPHGSLDQNFLENINSVEIDQDGPEYSFRINCLTKDGGIKMIKSSDYNKKFLI